VCLVVCFKAEKLNVTRGDSKGQNTYIVNTHKLSAPIWHLIHQCGYMIRHSLSFVYVLTIRHVALSNIHL